MMAMTYFDQVSYESPTRAWGELRFSARAGQAGFEHLHGMSAWEYRAQDADTSDAYSVATTGGNAEAAAIAAAYDFSAFTTVVDVGGGQGSLLTAILAAHTSVRGVLFDEPDVVSGASGVPQAAGVANRCEIVGGDFFRSLPSGGAAYLLKSIIHEWDDERSIAILTNCRRAMGQRGTLLLVEEVLADGDGHGLSTPADLNARGAPGGQERTEAEYRALFAAIGFTVTRIMPTGTRFSIIEGVAVRGTH